MLTHNIYYDGFTAKEFEKQPKKAATSTPRLSDQNQQKHASIGCVYDREECRFWASLGECEKNPGYMEAACSAACGRPGVPCTSTTTTIAKEFEEQPKKAATLIPTNILPHTPKPRCTRKKHHCLKCNDDQTMCTICRDAHYLVPNGSCQKSCPSYLIPAGNGRYKRACYHPKLVEYPKFEMPSIEEGDLWHGLVVPEQTKRRETESMRKLFNEDMSSVRDQAAELAEEQRTLPALLISVVVAFCSHSLAWLPAYLHGMSINDLTVYSKCNHTGKLNRSSFMDEIHSMPNNAIRIEELPNVGGCDHTYAHDMARRDWASFDDHRIVARKHAHVVLYLKDSDTQLCSQNMLANLWRVLRPSTITAVAAMTGFGCNIRTVGVETLWHATSAARGLRMKDYTRVSIRSHGPASVNTSKTPRNLIPFKSPNFRNLGEYADGMGVNLPAPFMPVCFGGNFAVSGGQFLNGVKVKVAHRMERALTRGDNIEEGHFAERLWSSFLGMPLNPKQVAAVDTLHKNVCTALHPTMPDNCNTSDAVTRRLKDFNMIGKLIRQFPLDPKRRPSKAGTGYLGGGCPAFH